MERIVARLSFNSSFGRAQRPHRVGSGVMGVCKEFVPRHSLSLTLRSLALRAVASLWKGDYNCLFNIGRPIILESSIFILNLMEIYYSCKLIMILIIPFCLYEIELF